MGGHWHVRQQYSWAAAGGSVCQRRTLTAPWRVPQDTGMNVEVVWSDDARLGVECEVCVSLEGGESMLPCRDNWLRDRWTRWQWDATPCNCTSSCDPSKSSAAAACTRKPHWPVPACMWNENFYALVYNNSTHACTQPFTCTQELAVGQT